MEHKESGALFKHQGYPCKGMAAHQRKFLKKGIFVDGVNGYEDHCHCVISLGVEQTIQKLMQLIKGESSFGINNKSGFEFPQGKRFQSQDEYFAVSVSQSQIDIVKNYLRNQETHHQKRTFNQECDELIPVVY